MRHLWAIVAALAVWTVALGSRDEARVNDAAITADALPSLLSDFGFFAGSADRPVRRLIAYSLNSPLFSDYADKTRYLYFPPGRRMTAGGDGRIIFPVGSAIIKTFSFRQSDGSLRHIETRVLLHRASGWVALPYIWRADGSDADLRLAGGRMPVSFVDAGGAERTISYAVPNRNQCRTCHQRDEVLIPIGPRVRNMALDRNIPIIPTSDFDSRNFAQLPRWDDAAAPLDARARAYLDVNCAHCHNPHGSASNSGLFLEYERPMWMAAGIWKRPTAAGRGSGGMDYAIRPGRPDESYLLYRMNSVDPGIAMPELGRGVIHDEGVALVREWIAVMPESAPPTGAAP